MQDDKAADNNLSVREIVDRVETVYRECESYRDTGVVKILFITANGERLDERPFKTAFIRPDRFRFQFSSENQNYVVWQRDDDIKSWWDLNPGVKQHPSFMMAIAGPTGVSGGSAFTIPSLLKPDEMPGGMSWLKTVTEWERLESGSIGDFTCIRLKGQPMPKQQTTLWIDEKTYLIRRIEEQTEFEDFETAKTTEYSPTIDVKITDKELEFRQTTGDDGWP